MARQNPVFYSFPQLASNPRLGYMTPTPDGAAGYGVNGIRTVEFAGPYYGTDPGTCCKSLAIP